MCSVIGFCQKTAINAKKMFYMKKCGIIIQLQYMHRIMKSHSHKTVTEQQFSINGSCRYRLLTKNGFKTPP